MSLLEDYCLCHFWRQQVQIKLIVLCKLFLVHLLGLLLLHLLNLFTCLVLCLYILGLLVLVRLEILKYRMHASQCEHQLRCLERSVLHKDLSEFFQFDDLGR